MCVWEEKKDLNIIWWVEFFLFDSTTGLIFHLAMIIMKL